MCACDERFDLKANEINEEKTLLHHIRPLAHLARNTHTSCTDYKMMIKLISTIIFALTWLYIHFAIHIPMFSIHLSHPFRRLILTLTPSLAPKHSLTPNALVRLLAQFERWNHFIASLGIALFIFKR